MSKKEIARNDTGRVTAIHPDWCLTPIGHLVLPVPYTIWADMKFTKNTVTHVKAKNQPVLNLHGSVSKAQGDEAGTLGGVFSGVNCGVCYPTSHSGTVRAGNAYVVRHMSVFAMNAPAVDGKPNTYGKLTMIKVRDVELKTDMTPATFKAAYEKIIARNPVTTLTEEDYEKAAKEAGVDKNVIKAIARQESGKDGAVGFIKGKLKMLWEPHVFKREFLKDYVTRPGAAKLQELFREVGIDIPLDTLANSIADAWTDQYGPTIIGPPLGRYGRESEQQDRLDIATGLDPETAGKGASFGLFQMMWQSVDGKRLDGKPLFENAQQFVAAMKESELRQLQEFTRFVKSNPSLQEAMKNKDWDKIARKYNGNNYRNHVDAAGRNYAENIELLYQELAAEDAAGVDEGADGVIIAAD